jgi:hypothetical protein
MDRDGEKQCDRVGRLVDTSLDYKAYEHFVLFFVHPQLL